MTFALGFRRTSDRNSQRCVGRRGCAYITTREHDNHHHDREDDERHAEPENHSIGRRRRQPGRGLGMPEPAGHLFVPSRKVGARRTRGSLGEEHHQGARPTEHRDKLRAATLHPPLMPPTGLGCQARNRPRLRRGSAASRPRRSPGALIRRLRSVRWLFWAAARLFGQEALFGQSRVGAYAFNAYNGIRRTTEEPTVAQLTVRNVDPEIARRLKLRAARHGRSRTSTVRFWSRCRGDRRTCSGRERRRAGPGRAAGDTPSAPA